MSRLCSSVSAVPRVATVLVKPAWCIETTSMYPSHRISSLRSLPLAKLRAKRFRLFLNTGVSLLLRYLGPFSPKFRPPKAITFPRRSMMGKMARLRKIS